MLSRFIAFILLLSAFQILSSEAYSQVTENKKYDITIKSIRNLLTDEEIKKSPYGKSSMSVASHDISREFYNEFNKSFRDFWKEKTTDYIEIKQTHLPSGKLTDNIIKGGIRPDVIALAEAYDTDFIAERSDVLSKEWQKRLPFDSVPYYSAVVFLVRKGNPKNIKDWNDLANEGVTVITPNPKTSGIAKWNYLAAWAYADKLYNHDEEKIKEFVRKIYKNVPFLDNGARGSTSTFVQRELGDVLVTLESEAFLILEQLGRGQFDIVIPSVTMRADFPVAFVNGNVSYNSTEDEAAFYTYYHYSVEAQEIAAKYKFRPADKAVADKYKANFPEINMISVDDTVFGGWKKVHETHFSGGGTFDMMYSRPGK